MTSPWLVLNLTIPWIVDGTTPNLSRVVRPSMMFCSDGYRMTTKSIRAVRRLVLSWLTNMNGK